MFCIRWKKPHLKTLYNLEKGASLMVSKSACSKRDFPLNSSPTYSPTCFIPVLPIRYGYLKLVSVKNKGFKFACTIHS
jgi:hypothetical protein